MKNTCLTHTVSQGESIGSATRTVVAWHLNERKHPGQAYRSCLGLLSLVKKYGDVRLERPHRQVIVKLMLNWRESDPTLQAESKKDSEPEHENVRGAGYYH